MSNYPKNPIVKSKDRIGFLGDSITELGNNNECGYVNLVMRGLADAGIEAEKVPAGISGHRAPDMLARIDNDVISQNVQFMTLSCGVNDVWHSFYPVPHGVDLPDYKRDITEIIDRAQSAGIKVLVMTATMIDEDVNNEKNQKLIPYNDFLREIAAEKNCILIDLNAVMQKIIAEYKKDFPGICPSTFLTIDGVHMNPAGNIMMAKELLKAFGIDEKVIESSAAKWGDLKFAHAHISLTADEFKAFNRQACNAGMTANAYASAVIKKAANSK